MLCRISPAFTMAKAKGKWFGVDHNNTTQPLLTDAHCCSQASSLLTEVNFTHRSKESDVSTRCLMRAQPKSRQQQQTAGCRQGYNPMKSILASVTLGVQLLNTGLHLTWWCFSQIHKHAVPGLCKQHCQRIQTGYVPPFSYSLLSTQPCGEEGYISVLKALAVKFKTNKYTPLYDKGNYRG